MNGQFLNFWVFLSRDTGQCCTKILMHKETVFALYFINMGFVYEANDFFSPFLSEIGE